MTASAQSLAPDEFARLLLNGIAVSEARSRRRKRDQKPDEAGLAIKRTLLEGIAAEAPDEAALGEWLLDRVLASPVSGATRAMAAMVLEEYQVARSDPEFRRWLGQASGDES
ncbi:MAG: type III secretion fhipep protein [Chloroflexi bacterium]|nr:type III secretion fhipep protein [Chloroflexota bacterium]